MNVIEFRIASTASGDLIDLIQETLKHREHKKSPDSKVIKSRAMHNDEQILLISIRIIGQRFKSRFSCRIYDHGTIALNEEGCKSGYELTMQDLEDIICKADARGYSFEQIGILVFGVVREENLTLPALTFINDIISEYFTEHCELQLTVINNMDAAVPGLYRQQDQVRNMLLYQPKDHVCGDAGIIIDGNF